MEPILKKITLLLDSENLDTKRAAVRVLAELNLKDKELVRMFGQRLEKETDQLVRSLILDYAGRHPSKEFLPYLTDSLKDFGAGREKTIQALQNYGDGAVPGLIQAYQKAQEPNGRPILTTIAGIPSVKSYDFLLNTMKQNHSLDHAKFVCYLSRTLLEKADKPSRVMFRKSLLDFYKENKKDRMQATSALILFGYLKDPADKKYLVDAIVQAKGDFHQRKHSLNSLVSLNLSGKGHDDVISVVMLQLSDSDFPNIVRPAISILERLEITKKYQKELQQLLNSHHSSVRSFALQKLSSFDSPENVDMLLKHLDSNDFRVKQAAQSSLEKLPKALPKLLKIFEAAATFERADQLIRILKVHREQFKPALLKKYYLRMEQLLRKSDEKFRHYLLLIRSVNQEFLYVNVMKKYKALKTKKKWLDAGNCLNLLENVLAQSHELRLESAICKIMSEKVDYSIVARDRNQGLLALQGIAKSRPANELAKIIISDKKIDDEHKYLIGFHFSEKQMNLREFGSLILKSCAKKSGKYGKLAKKKLDSIATEAVKPTLQYT